MSHPVGVALFAPNVPDNANVDADVSVNVTVELLRRGAIGSSLINLRV